MPKSARDIRIVIADDHPLFREGVKAALDRHDDLSVVGEAADARQARDLAAALRPDVILLDCRMPEGGGLAALRAILREDAGARVLVLTSSDRDQDAFEAIETGARGFLQKTADSNVLADAIRAIAQGQRVIPPEISSKLARHVNDEPLTDREIDVLALIGEGLANREIAARLSIAEGTVRTHVNNILAKLKAKSRTEAVSVAVKRGLIQL